MASARVMVVDDDTGILEFICLALTDEGYEVITATDGATALELASSASPDLILLDMHMPTMDGWEFSQAYREQCGSQAPIVVLTAARDAEGNARQIEADGSLTKPFNIEDLLAVVESYTAQ